MDTNNILTNFAKIFNVILYYLFTILLFGGVIGFYCTERYTMSVLFYFGFNLLFFDATTTLKKKMQEKNTKYDMFFRRMMILLLLFSALGYVVFFLILYNTSYQASIISLAFGIIYLFLFINRFRKREYELTIIDDVLYVVKEKKLLLGTYPKDDIFWGKEFLTVCIPDGVKTLKSNCFENCENLIAINIPKTVSLIEFGIFSQCHMLQHISISNENTDYVLENGVLYNYEKSHIHTVLPTVKSYQFLVPLGINKIYKYAFRGCASELIVIPPTVESIGEGAFLQAYLLKKIIIDSHHARYSFENSMLLDKISKVIHTSLPVSHKVKVEDGMLEIGSLAFANQKMLFWIDLPVSISHISSDAFSGCTKLKLIVHKDSYSYNFAIKHGFRYKLK